MFLFTAIEKFSEINFHRKNAVFKLKKFFTVFLSSCLHSLFGDSPLICKRMDMEKRYINIEGYVFAKCRISKHCIFVYRHGSNRPMIRRESHEETVLHRWYPAGGDPVASCCFGSNARGMEHISRRQSAENGDFES